ncbi:hypothetical protein D3C85_1229500 [compost metagenome]
MYLTFDIDIFTKYPAIIPAHKQWGAGDIEGRLTSDPLKYSNCDNVSILLSRTCGKVRFCGGISDLRSFASGDNLRSSTERYKKEETKWEDGEGCWPKTHHCYS